MGQKVNGLAEPFLTITITYDVALGKFVAECHGGFFIAEHLTPVINSFMTGIDLLMRKFQPGLAAIHNEKMKQKGK